MLIKNKEIVKKVVDLFGDNSFTSVDVYNLCMSINQRFKLDITFSLIEQVLEELYENNEITMEEVSMSIYVCKKVSNNLQKYPNQR